MAQAKVHATVGDDRVAVIEFTNGRHNFLDGALAAALADAAEAVADEGARSVLLCSTGRHFCAGADFSGGGDDDFFGDVLAGLHPSDHVLRLMAQPLPVVAVCQGSAIGGGLGLALACDFRLASPESRFAAPFVRLGLHPGCGTTVTLSSVVGQQHAQDLLLTGRRIGGDGALAMGLVDELVPTRSLPARGRTFAAEIAATAPITLRSVRAALRGPLIERVRAAMAEERVEQARQRATQDHAEGVAADLERRTPAFRGA
jgi:2-(1,2-epoxy-1,2-dihydrophenyl)acetyl-CoA isomerase